METINSKGNIKCEKATSNYLLHNVHLKLSASNIFLIKEYSLEHFLFLVVVINELEQIIIYTGNGVLKFCYPNFTDNL